MSYTKKITVSPFDNTLEICEPKIAPSGRDPNTHWCLNGDEWQETTIRQEVNKHNIKMSLMEYSASQGEICLISIPHFFDQDNLSSLFQRGGFILEQSFPVDNMGKKINRTLLGDQEIPFDQIRSVTIIAKKPSK